MKVSVREIHTETPEGDDHRAIVATVVLYASERDALMTEYDPQYGATPGVTLCRPIVREICAQIALLEDT